MSWRLSQPGSDEDEWFENSKPAEERGPARVIRMKEGIQEAKRFWSHADEQKAGKKCLIRKIYNNRYCKVSFQDEEGDWDEITCLLPINILRQDSDEVETYHFERDADIMYLYLESVEADRVEIFDVLAVAPWCLRTENSSAKALMCMFIQILVPLILIAGTITQLLHPKGTPSWNWEGLCSPKKAWTNPQILLKISNKITSVALLMYTYNYITKVMYDLDTRPMIDLLKSELCYKRLEKPLWAVFGLLTNALSLAACGIASVFVIFVSESILDTVLNAFAIFFLIKLDDDIVDRVDLDDFKEYIREEVETLNQPVEEDQEGSGVFDTSTSYRARNRPLWFGKAWKFAFNVVALVSLCIVAAVPYVAICKVGVDENK